MKHLPEWSERRKRNSYLYNENLKETDLITPIEIDDIKAVYHLYVVRVQRELSKGLQDHLKAKGISTGIRYPIALPNLKAYSYLSHSPNDFPEATKASQEILSLPMYSELEAMQIHYIADSIKEFCL